MIKNRVCIVTNGIFGIPCDSEISLFYGELAQLLASSGYDVTILLVNNNILQYYEKLKFVDSFCANNNIKLFYIPPGNNGNISFGLENENLIYSYKIYKWFLSQQGFNIIHFHDFEGFGFYSLLAKHQGLAFQDSTVYVKTFHPTRWKLFANMSYFDSTVYITTDYIERKSIEMCDVLISSSQYMINWVKDNSWKMPKKIFVMPNIINKKKIINNTRSHYNTNQSDNYSIKELVYFGNLDKQKGLDVFLNAVDILNEKAGLPISDLTVSIILIGEVANKVLQNIQDRSKKWNCRTNLIDSFDFDQSVKYLCGIGKVAVLPYLMDNDPYAITACLHYGIPFLVSDKIALLDSVGEIDIFKSAFSPKPVTLANKINDILLYGVKPAEPVLDMGDIKQNWVKFSEETINIKSNNPIGLTTKPKVSVCLIHHERPRLLKYAINSLREQDYTNFEIILIDDGSKDSESHEYLNSLSEEFNEKDWKIIKQDNLYLGAARNRAVKESIGEYILFMDDDDYAKPYEISTFVKAMANSGADILTCFTETFNSESQPNEKNVMQTLIFTGDVAAGLFENCFGPANAMFKKNTFLDIGGYTEIKGVGFEDWELFARAVLKGYHLEVIPESLFYYRRIHNNKNNMLNFTNSYYNDQRSLIPYMNKFGVDMSPAMMYLKNSRKFEYQVSFLNHYISALKQELKDKFNIVMVD